MTDIQIYSLIFFASILVYSLLVYLARTAPFSTSKGGLAKHSWSVWFAQQIQSSMGIEREAFLARLAKLVVIVCKYGIAAWTLFNPESLSLRFWVLVWVLLLVVETLRKAAQFYIPVKWENVSLKLDSEHFWLIHLIVLGTAELQINGSAPWGIATLVGFYLLFAGESKSSILASIEDVASCAWATVALLYLAGTAIDNVVKFGAILGIVLMARGIVRLVFGRAWIRRRFWWVAQFCLMTSLIIKSLVVLDVFSVFNS